MSFVKWLFRKLKGKKTLNVLAMEECNSRTKTKQRKANTRNEEHYKNQYNTQKEHMQMSKSDSRRNLQYLQVHW